MREVVSSKPRRGYTPVSTQVDSGLHPLIRPVARRQVSSCLTVSLDTGLSHIRPGISIDDAFYPWWDLDVLSNERRLTGECRCRYDSRAAEDVLGVVGCSNQNISTCPLSGPRSFNVNPCHIPLGLTKTTTISKPLTTHGRPETENRITTKL